MNDSNSKENSPQFAALSGRFFDSVAMIKKEFADKNNQNINKIIVSINEIDLELKKFAEAFQSSTLGLNRLALNSVYKKNDFLEEIEQEEKIMMSDEIKTTLLPYIKKDITNIMQYGDFYQDILIPFFNSVYEIKAIIREVINKIKKAIQVDAEDFSADEHRIIYITELLNIELILNTQLNNLNQKHIKYLEIIRNLAEHFTWEDFDHNIRSILENDFEISYFPWIEGWIENIGDHYNAEDVFLSACAATRSVREEIQENQNKIAGIIY